MKSDKINATMVIGGKVIDIKISKERAAQIIRLQALIRKSKGIDTPAYLT